MSQTQKMKPFELLKAARDKRRISITFDIPLDDQIKIRAELTAIDASEIMVEQDLVLLDKMADCERRGLHKKKFVESKWNSTGMTYLRSVRLTFSISCGGPGATLARAQSQCRPATDHCQSRDRTVPPAECDRYSLRPPPQHTLRVY